MAYTLIEPIRQVGKVQDWYYTVGSLSDPSSQELKPNTTQTLLFTHFNIALHGASTWAYKNPRNSIQPGVTLRLADPAVSTLQEWSFPYFNNTSGFNANLQTEIVVAPEYGFNVIVDSIYSASTDISFRFRARSIIIDPATTTPFT
jgi:hypothetical protein